MFFVPLKALGFFILPPAKTFHFSNIVTGQTIFFLQISQRFLIFFSSSNYHIKGIFPPHMQCSWDRLQIKDREDGWMNKWITGNPTNHTETSFHWKVGQELGRRQGWTYGTLRERNHCMRNVIEIKSVIPYYDCYLIKVFSCTPDKANQSTKRHHTCSRTFNSSANLLTFSPSGSTSAKSRCCADKSRGKQAD